jgi:hypothetical protein
MYQLSRKQLAAMQEESRLRDAYAGRPQPREFPPVPRSTGNPQADWARECVLAGRPVTILTPAEIEALSPKVEGPEVFVPPTEGGPMKAAIGLLTDCCGVQPGLVAAIKVQAKALGISISTLKRAKKFLGLNHIEKNGASYWGLPAALDP